MLASLPIDPVLGPLCQALRLSAAAVVVASPGAGKTTRIPPALVGSNLFSGQLIMLQPRRVAARASAARIACEQRWTLGQEVGYHIRHERVASARTRLLVMTEGMLTRRIQSDPFLEGVGCVVLDEFHERSIHTDLALAFLKDIQSSVRPDLKILVMSATMDPAPVSEFLAGAPVFRADIPLHQVAVTYQLQPDARPVDERMAEAIARALPTVAGHILAFLPGLREIRATAGRLSLPGSTRLHLLHSSIPAAEQDAALAPSSQQKVILSTSIAETSLTIDGVRLVIDSGLARMPERNARLGTDHLVTRRVSKAGATQRAGRAGRTGPGACHRLYTAAEFGGFAEFEQPELFRSDLVPTLLTVKAYGVTDAERFAWFEAPASAAIENAERTLWQLGLSDSSGQLTSLAHTLASMPLHPRLACVLYQAARAGAGRRGASLCAMLSDDFRGSMRGTRSKRPTESDALTLLEVSENDLPWSVRQGAKQLATIARDIPVSQGVGLEADEALLRALLAGFPDRVAMRRGAGSDRAVTAVGRGVQVGRESAVVSAMLFVAVDVRDDGQHTDGLVTLGSAVRAEWLEELFPHLVERATTVRFDAERQKVVAVREKRFLQLVLESHTTGAIPKDCDPGIAVAAYLAEKYSSAMGAVAEDEAADGWARRYQFVCGAMPELELQPLDFDAALAGAASGCATPQQVYAGALVHHVRMQVPSAVANRIDELAPAALTVPSGHRHRIDYPALNESGGQPVLAVRLQELFGLPETPRLVGGRIPLLIHLLAPNHRPVQVTSDLRSFWNTTYAEVRKQLRARYPKHPWPEDPWNAPAVSIGRRRQSPPQ